MPGGLRSEGGGEDLPARLLGADADALLEAASLGSPFPRDATLLGNLFESLVTLCIRVQAQAAEASVKHLRTKGDEREVDLMWNEPIIGSSPWR